MRRALVQLACCIVIVAGCFAALAWIEATRPGDPPLVRGDALRLPTPTFVVPERDAFTPTVVLPGTATLDRQVTLRAGASGKVRFTQGPLLRGSHVMAGQVAVPALAAKRQDTEGPGPQEAGNGEAGYEDLDLVPALELRDVLVVIDGERLALEKERAHLEVRRAASDLRVLNEDVVRFTALLELARRNLELHQNWYDRVRGRRESATGSAAALGVSDQTVEDVARALGASATNLRTVEGNLAVASASLETARLTLEVARRSARLALERERDAHVISPVAGYVLERTVNDGEYVTAGAPLLEIAVLDPLRVQVHVPSEVYARFRREMTAAVAFPSLASVTSATLWPADDPRAFADALVAELVTARPVADPRRRSVLVEFALSNPVGRLGAPAFDGRIPAGLACRVRLQLAPIPDALRIPENLVIVRDGTSYVVRVEATDPTRVAFVPVLVRHAQEGTCLIETSERHSGEPLRPGDRLASNHLDVLRDGDEVCVILAEPSGNGE